MAIRCMWQVLTLFVTHTVRTLGVATTNGKLFGLLLSKYKVRGNIAFPEEIAEIKGLVKDL